MKTKNYIQMYKQIIYFFTVPLISVNFNLNSDTLMSVYVNKLNENFSVNLEKQTNICVIR